MNTLRKQLLISVAMLGMGSAAFAAQAPTAAPAPEGRHAHAANQQERMARWSEHFAQRQAKIHDALQLSAGQESAWAAYQAAIKPAATGMMQGDHAAWAALPAPARMEKMIAVAKQHTAEMESHLTALNTFYSVLTPAQKKAFDAATMHDGRGRGHGGMKGPMMQR